MRKYFKKTTMKHKFFTYSLLFATAAAVPFLSTVNVNADAVPVGPPVAEEITLGFSTADDLNVRAAASTSSESLMKVKAGDSMIILGEENDWYKVNVDGKIGYMKKLYVNDECIAFATTQNLNLRQTADSKGAVVNQFNQGDPMTVIEKEGDWYKVFYDETIGYVSKDFVDFQYNIYIDGSDINMRKGATTESEVITTLDNAEIITVLNKTGEWYKVRYDGKIGYVKDSCTSFTEPVEEVPVVETTTSNKNSSNKTSSSNKKTSNKKTNSSNKTSSSNKNSYSGGSTVSGGSGQSVVNYALQFVGNPYKYGGNSLTNGIDCSGFVKAIYAHFGVSLPRTSSSLRSVGKSVGSLSNAKPGDIICYSGHVAIYMGGNKIVHASNKKDGIKISNNAAYKSIITIRRIFE